MRKYFFLLTTYLVWNRWHHFENLAAYEYDIWFYWIRNKNGPPKDIWGWFETVEIFMWSNLRWSEFTWTTMNWELLNGIVLIADIYKDCYPVVVSWAFAANQSSSRYIWMEFIYHYSFKNRIELLIISTLCNRLLN